MDSQKILNTSGLFLGGAYSLLKGIDYGIKHAAKGSPVTLLKTGVILFPLSILIGIATKKIFDDMGWQPSEARDLTIYLFSFISSTALASAAAVGFGFTTSLSTGWTVSAIAIYLLSGVSLIALGIMNICSNENHPAPQMLYI